LRLGVPEASPTPRPGEAAGPLYPPSAFRYGAADSRGMHP